MNIPMNYDECRLLTRETLSTEIRINEVVARVSDCRRTHRVGNSNL